MSNLKKYNIGSVKFYLKYVFLNKSNKILLLNKLKNVCLSNIDSMKSNIELCDKFFKEELENSFYLNTSNFNIFKHLYRNSVKSLNYNLCELNKINYLLLKIGH